MPIRAHDLGTTVYLRLRLGGRVYVEKTVFFWQKGVYTCLVLFFTVNCWKRSYKECRFGIAPFMWQPSSLSMASSPLAFRLLPPPCFLSYPLGCYCFYSASPLKIAVQPSSKQLPTTGRTTLLLLRDHSDYERYAPRSPSLSTVNIHPHQKQHPKLTTAAAINDNILYESF